MALSPQQFANLSACGLGVNLIIPNSETFSIGKAGGVPVSSSWHTAKLRAALSDDERLESKYRLQAKAARLLPGERVASCMRSISPGRGGVEVIHTPGRGASYRGLMTCGSVWACPICASRITERRKAELQAALDDWSGFAVMAAFTLQHSQDDTLKELLNHLKAAFQALARDRQVKNLKAQYGIIGTVSSLEVTHGASGWHPHRHVLYLSERKLSTAEIEALERGISERWRMILKRRGRYGGESCAVVFTAGGTNQAAAAYVAKGAWGAAAELAKSPVKSGRSGNRSPFQLLEASDNDAQAAALFREYYFAFKRSHQLQFSRGLRALLGMAAELTDEELAAVEDEGVVMMSISPAVWYSICRRELRAKLLNKARSGDVDALQAWMDEQGLAPGYQ